MTRKRVIFHVGAPKTGTTYLQSIFSQHCKQLNAAGIDYPFPETKEVIESGALVGNVIRFLYIKGLIKQEKNAFKMDDLNKLWSEQCTDNLLQIAEESEYETILFSSEGMSLLNERELKSLYGKFSQKFDIRFILFVRDPFDYSYSAWRQALKAQLSTKSFSEYLTDRIARNSKKQKKFGMFNIAEVLVNNKMSCKIINYDTYREELANKFFEHINIQVKLDYIESTLNTSLHNRSFSLSEAEIQSIVNNKFKDSQFPLYFRKSLLSRKGYRTSQKSFYDSDLDKSILNNFHSLIDKVNNLIIGDRIRLTPKNIPSMMPKIEPEDVEVLIDSIKFVDSTRSRRLPLIVKIRHFLKAGFMNNVPFDFDPHAYLEMNNDIALSGLDPYIHYSRNGYLEGRPYRYY
jgi:hypothetical protein